MHEGQSTVQAFKVLSSRMKKIASDYMV